MMDFNALCEDRNGLLWPKNDVVAHQIILDEVHDIRYIMPHVKNKNIVVQAGGNCGIWPKWFSPIFKEVYTFESDPVNFYCLDKNAIEPNIHKFNAALGNTVGSVDIKYDDNGNIGAHRVVAPSFQGQKENYTVDLITIDSLGLEKCDLIQLDIEGYEHLAILGAENTIKKFKPIVVLELKGHGERYGYTDQATIDMLKDWDFSIVSKIRNDFVFESK